MELPLSIRSALHGPYEDAYSEERIQYRYRGTDPMHRENVGLRQAMTSHAPLVYLFAVDEGQYLPIWPVYVIGDDPAGLTFEVSVDDQRFVEMGPSVVVEWRPSRDALASRMEAFLALE